jgi:hypothetical protein
VVEATLILLAFGRGTVIAAFRESEERILIGAESDPQIPPRRLTDADVCSRMMPAVVFGMLRDECPWLAR